jgi:hypothetical protein
MNCTTELSDPFGRPETSTPQPPSTSNPVRPISGSVWPTQQGSERPALDTAHGTLEDRPLVSGRDARVPPTSHCDRARTPRARFLCAFAHALSLSRRPDTRSPSSAASSFSAPCSFAFGRARAASHVVLPPEGTQGTRDAQCPGSSRECAQGTSPSARSSGQSSARVR